MNKQVAEGEPFGGGGAEVLRSGTKLYDDRCAKGLPPPKHANKWSREELQRDEKHNYMILPTTPPSSSLSGTTSANHCLRRDNLKAVASAIPMADLQSYDPPRGSWGQGGA
eukprot:1176896-Amphidinium_carterae.1